MRTASSISDLHPIADLGRATTEALPRGSPSEVGSMKLPGSTAGSAGPWQVPASSAAPMFVPSGCRAHRERRVAPYGLFTAGVSGICSHPLGIAGILIAATRTRVPHGTNGARSAFRPGTGLDLTMYGEGTAAKEYESVMAQGLRATRNCTSSWEYTSMVPYQPFVSALRS